MFPVNCLQSLDLILFGHQICRYVEHLFHCEIFSVLDGMLIVWVILSHEYCWFQSYRHEHSPYHRMFFVVFCNLHRRSFLSFPHLIIHPTTVAIMFRPLQWWIAVALLLFESRQRVSPFYHPSIHQLSTLEKTKLCHRPTLSNVLRTSFQQIACGGALARDPCHGQQRVSPFYHISQLSHSTLTFIPFLHQAFWRRRWQSRGSPCNQTHHWPWLRCDSFFT